MVTSWSTCVDSVCSFLQARKGIPSGPGDELLVLVVASCTCLCVIAHLCGEVGRRGCICFGCWCGPECVCGSCGVCIADVELVPLADACCGVDVCRFRLLVFACCAALVGDGAVVVVLLCAAAGVVVW